MRDQNSALYVPDELTKDLMKKIKELFMRKTKFFVNL